MGPRAIVTRKINEMDKHRQKVHPTQPYLLFNPTQYCTLPNIYHTLALILTYPTPRFINPNKTGKEEEDVTTSLALSASVVLRHWPYGAIPSSSPSSSSSSSSSTSSQPSAHRIIRNSEADRMRVLGPLLALVFEEARFTDLAGVYLSDAIYVR